MEPIVTYKDQRLFSINDIISIGGAVAGAVLSALKSKHPLIKMKDIDPEYTGEETVWNVLALENAQKSSFSSNYDPKVYRDKQNSSKDFSNYTLIEVEYVEDSDDTDAYYILRNTETGELEDYEDWDSVNKRFIEARNFVGSWISAGNPPPSNIRWDISADDSE